MNVPHGPILIVEDVPHIRELLSVTLNFKGYPVLSAANGQAALDLIAEQPPALIITDILMPKMDGYTLIQKLRSKSSTSRIPIIVLTATYITPEDKAFALSLGVVRFMEKPVDTDEFLLTVAEVLTTGCQEFPPPLGDEKFYRGYRERLENKLRHKNIQIARTKRLLEALPSEQKPAFESLLAEARTQLAEIHQELDDLYHLLERYT